MTSFQRIAIGSRVVYLTRQCIGAMRAAQLFRRIGKSPATIMRSHRSEIVRSEEVQGDYGRWSRYYYGGCKNHLSEEEHYQYLESCHS